MLNKLTSVKDKDSVKKLSEFSSITKNSRSIYANGKLTLGLDYNEISSLCCAPQKVFYSNDKVYLYCQDKRVYALDGEKTNKISITEFDDVRNIIYLKDQDATLIFDGDKMHVFGKSQSVITCPKSKDEFYFDGRVFFVGKDSVYFNSTPNGIDGIKRQTAKSYIGVSKSFGDIVYANSFSDGITVLTKDYAVDYQTGFSLDEFYLKNSLRLNFPIEENSAVKVRDKFYYFSNGKIVSFGEKQIIEYDGLENYTVNGRAKKYQNYYLLPVSLKGEKLVFVFDVLTKKTCFIKQTGEFFGGYQLLGDKLYALSSVISFENATWESKEIILSKSRSKTVRKIEVLGKDLKIQVLGENGNALIYADDYAKKFTGITGKKITVKVFATGKDFNLEEILLYFR